MASINQPLGFEFDWGSLVTTVVDTAGKITTAVIDKNGRVATVNQGNQQSSGAGGFNPGPYIPWVLGGLGVIVAFSMLRR